MDKPIKYELKSWPSFFSEIIAGRKTHDLRRSTDRKFSVGDLLKLKEWNPDTETYTGRDVIVQITYITDEAHACAYSPTALESGFAILSIKLV